MIIDGSQRASDRRSKPQSPQRDRRARRRHHRRRDRAPLPAAGRGRQRPAGRGRGACPLAARAHAASDCSSAPTPPASASGCRATRRAPAIAAAAHWAGPLARIGLALNCVAADLARPSYERLADRRMRPLRPRSGAADGRDHRKQPGHRPHARRRQARLAAPVGRARSRSTISAPAMPTSPI